MNLEIEFSVCACSEHTNCSGAVWSITVGSCRLPEFCDSVTRAGLDAALQQIGYSREEFLLVAVASEED